MAASRHEQRLVITGASSLLGAELKSLLEESLFASWDLRLVDEENVAGTLTEAGGEAAVIQRVEEDTFRDAKFAFLTGSREFGKQCLAAARQSGAIVLDLTRASLSDPDSAPWFPRIEALSGASIDKSGRVFTVFSAGAAAIASLALAMRPFGPQRVVGTLFEPVSSAGRPGIEELETQTTQLLSFQPIGTQLFGTQTAFNLLPRYGGESRHDLQRNLLELRAEVSAALRAPGEDAQVSLNLVHVPVFYGSAFSACADLGAEASREALATACREGGFVLEPPEEPSPNNISVAGETALHLAEPRLDSARSNSWWFWGAADNLRFPAWSAIKLAEFLQS